ncbi:hypothetical protein ON010_g1862 [Phytophthora cinnamomi]|nr:hypothetical protein ON010_g1862 [Phytophthora cinnamomi]
MATTSASAAEAPARPDMPETADPATPSSAQPTRADEDQVSSAETPQDTQETQNKEPPLDGQSVAMKCSGSPGGGGDAAQRHVRQGASAAAPEKPPQPAPAEGEAKTQDVAMSADEGKDVAMLKEERTPAEEGRRRPSRAAAAAANADMARQAKEEAGSLGMLMASALMRPMEQDLMVEPTSIDKKRTSEMATPPAKRSRVTATQGSKTVTQDTLDIASADLQPQRGKKRRQAPVFEAAPIITDLPPLPFTTTSPELKLKNKSKTKNKQAGTSKTKVNPSVEQVQGDDVRHCEFCRKTANLCVLMHCHACRRVYHAQCFWHAFKPYVDAKVPILNQLERLQLEAPERRGNIFRCVSCRAAFVDFCESGGYLWECDCPTCSQPEKVVYYRQRKLVHMMNDMELEKQRKRDQKGQGAKAKKFGAAKPAISAPSSNSTPRSRRTRGSSAALDEEVVDERAAQPSKSLEGDEPKKENDVNNADPMDVNDGVDNQPASEEPAGVEKTTVAQQISETKSNPKPSQPLTDDTCKQERAGSHMNQGPAPTRQQEDDSSLKIKYEPVGEPEQPDLKGDDLVGAVRVQREGKTDYWCFPVVCSRTTSLRVSGMMKTGTCKWSLKKKAVIQCECCDKLFSYPEFAHHTDSDLVKDVRCANEDPMPYLFVEHRDTTHHTTLDDFLPALRAWAARQSANNTPTKSRKGHAVRHEAIAAVVAPTMTMTDPEAAAEALPATITRLRALALFKRPKHRSDKTSLAARLSDPASLDFLAQVVCLSPKYVMNMSNGSLADRVVRSQTPVPDDSFPRKTGWLAFNRKAVASRLVTCTCCEQSFNFDGFVGHAGISLNEVKKKPRQLLYVVERMDESAVVPFSAFAMDLDTLAKGNGLDPFLDELHPPPPSPRPL